VDAANRHPEPDATPLAVSRTEVNPTIKRVLEAALLKGGGAHVARLLTRYHSLILAYHNVVPDDAPTAWDLSLHLPRRRFAEQLDLLVESHEVVSLPTLLRPPSPDHPRPRAAITFDDAYQGAVSIGVQEARKRSLPVTVFVSPGNVGRGPFWWDLFADANGRESPLPFRNYALQQCGGKTDVIHEWARRSGIVARDVPAYLHAATEDELRNAAAQPGVTLASHSWSHPNLTALAAPELQTELDAPLRWLLQRFETVIPWLAYPYGLTSLAVRKAAAYVGYEAALIAAGGSFSSRTADPLQLPRIDVPVGLSHNGFALRLAGVLTR
jgi:peptidoglycan/xylan/chitin deacetylase (PgdA/CDA1 family)